MIVLAGPPGVIAVVLLGALAMADRRAREEFFRSLARSLGYRYATATQMLPLTPLLGAGDRRRWERAISGPLDREDPALGECTLCHYTYEVRSERRGDDRNTTWEPHHFTICAIDLESSLTRFKGVFLRPRRGLFDRLERDRLSHLRLRRVHLESLAFNDAYDLEVANEQDDRALRELFAPSLVSWLGAHPLSPNFELRAGMLVVFLAGHVEEAGKLIWLLDATRHLARRVVDEVDEEQRRPAAHLLRGLPLERSSSAPSSALP